MGEREGRGVLGGILDDIRNKLVDEGWFGRRPTEARDDPLGRWGGADWAGADDDFARDWAVKEPSPSATGNDRDRGVDR